MTKIRMKGPENTGGFSHNAASFEADENGFIEVPGDITNVAKAHGFVVVTEKPAPRVLAKGGDGKKSGKPGEVEDAGGAKDGDGK